MDTHPVPAAFIGHGSPMNAIEQNRWTTSWSALGSTLPPLRGVLAISAHWFIGTTAVTAMAEPRTIHDFHGFPPELSRFSYPAPGDPSLAQQVADLLDTAEVSLDLGAWGLDHGTWSVLAHLLPAANVPVVQLSVNRNLTVREHVELGRRLAPLRTQGILVLGSGNVVHNLGIMDWARPDGADEWAERFDAASRHAVEQADGMTEAFCSLVDHPDAPLAVPTPEHFLPLGYLVGLASSAEGSLRPITEGIVFGSISMSSWVLD